MDASGKDLKTAESASPANLPTHGDIDGYNYVTARQDDKAGEVLYVFAKKSGDEVKTSSKEAEQQAPAKQEAKQTQPTQQAPSASAPAAQTPSASAQTSAQQTKPAQSSAPQATKTSELPTTGDAGSILSALSVLPAALAGLALRKKRED